MPFSIILKLCGLFYFTPSAAIANHVYSKLLPYMFNIIPVLTWPPHMKN